MFSFFKRKKAASINDTALLQSKHCDKCQRNCLLSSPKCNKGREQADTFMKSFIQAGNANE